MSLTCAIPCLLSSARDSPTSRRELLSRFHTPGHVCGRQGAGGRESETDRSRYDRKKEAGHEASGPQLTGTGRCSVSAEKRSERDRSVSSMPKKRGSTEFIPDMTLEVRQDVFHGCPVLEKVAEHHPPFEAGDHHPGAGARVPFGEFTVADAPRDEVLERSDQLRHCLPRRGTQLGVGIVALDGEVHDWTPPPEHLVVRVLLPEEVQDRQQRLGRRRAPCQGAPETLAFRRNRVLEGLEGQRRAAIEMAVDATLPQPGDAHDLGHRGAAIALSVEEARRLGHDPPPSCLALFHLPLKKETGRSLVYK